ncbi:MAG: sugar phosphate nucleotidyltransferase [Rubripirellula sp.]|nr:sugar phosphate nucleotidyltransferase [Rubripirellula sp.]
MDDLSKSMIPDTLTIRQALASINDTAKGIALIVDDQQRLIGTITDGDLRRAILAGSQVEEPVSVVLAAKPVERRQPISGNPEMSDMELIALMDHHGLRHIPVLRQDGQVERLVIRNEVVSHCPAAVDAVVLADPIACLPNAADEFRNTIGSLQESGFAEIYVLASEKSTSLRQTVEGCEAVDWVLIGQEISIREQLMGLGSHDATWLVVDRALTMSLNLQALIHFHHDHNAAVTMGVRRYDLKVPYGVIKTEGSSIQSLHEKPAYQFVVNEGLYLLNSALVHQLDQACETMPALVNQLISRGDVVATFPIIEYWLDLPRVEATGALQAQLGSKKWAA